MALQRLIELTLGDVSEDLILSFICRAVRDSGGKKKKEEKKKRTNMANINLQKTNPVLDISALVVINEHSRRTGSILEHSASRQTSSLIKKTHGLQGAGLSS